MARNVENACAGHDLVALAPEATAREAAQSMRDANCGSVLVMSGQELLGIVTERDVINRVVAEQRDPEATLLSDIMTRDPDTIDRGEPALRALQMMDDGGYRHLPVLDRGQVVGVVSRRDFFVEEKARLDRVRHLWEVMG